MNIKPNTPPREFTVGFEEHRVVLKDCAHIELSADEQVTLLTDNGGEYDVSRKSWGFYATPSLNGRLPKYNLRPALVKNRVDQFFIVLIEKGKEDMFEEYRNIEQLKFVTWLDQIKPLKQIEHSFHDQK